MTDYGPDVGNERHINTARLWTGGLATAVVAALVIFVGTLIVRGVFDIPILAQEEVGSLGDAGTAVYALLAAVAALIATGLLHLLMLSAPRPLNFFGWIVGLATAVAVVTPFAQNAPLASAGATALINLVTGLVVMSLLTGVGASVWSARRVQRRPTRDDGSLPGSGYTPGVPRQAGSVPEQTGGGRHRKIASRPYLPHD
ncbi:DUF6069 family protein [Nocardiopsis ansamitocini]|uniref:Uncharacterized protein n=1 Tax=Nocardiopsis ansamitocini TaxID=1670832 RepID=A0A9W6P5Q2_9ACTN|nr:DUF6069 family protein [Nocardiopsis ansamitocini]GLU47556.1 hypothetical protein Nans01_19070 [Nocardiopsis ansamitocini]